MLGEKQRAAVQPATPRCGNVSRVNYNTGYPTKSNGNLQDQIGLLLWQLQSPLNKQQHKAGWSLLGILISQYLADKGDYEYET